MLMVTHVYVALLLEKKYNIQNNGGYYLGTVIPDIRYFAHIPREQTHFPRNQILNKFGVHSDKSFLRGYDIHLSLDEFTIETNIICELIKPFPGSIRKCISGYIIENLFASYCMEKLSPIDRIQLLNKYPVMMKDIGVYEDAFESFIRINQQILDSLSISAFGSVIRDPVLKRHKRLRKLHRTAKVIERYQAIRRYLMNTIGERMEVFIDEFQSSYEPII